MAEFIVRGLPASLANDAWWLSAETSSPPDGTRTSTRTRHTAMAGLVLVALVTLADLLFWNHAVGLSLVVFSAALCGAALFSLALRLSQKGWICLSLAWVAAALPVLEYVQFTSVVILLLGHLGLLVWAATRTANWPRILGLVLRLPWLAPLFIFVTGRDAAQTAQVPRVMQIPRDFLLALVLPVLATAVFVILLINANPLFARWLGSLAEVRLDIADPARIAFWIWVALAIFPFVAFRKFAAYFAKPPQPRPTRAPRTGRLINAQSITLSLLLFNALFLTQNLTDLAILWGGAALPEGLTYAKYAHQGAYPLMATSVLAGLFVLVSRRFTDTAPMLRLLLLIWIVQNLFLVCSALMRLELYVEAYGLTYLRVRAGIGMGLVLIGMGLLAWQLWAHKSNAWVAGLFAGLCAATLYSGCFVNFGALIARHNLAQSKTRLDEGYLCRTTPLALPAIYAHARSEGAFWCRHRLDHWDVAPEGWRDWSYRASRLATTQQAYLTLIQAGTMTSPAPTPTLTPTEETRDEPRNSDRGR